MHAASDTEDILEHEPENEPEPESEPEPKPKSITPKQKYNKKEGNKKNLFLAFSLYNFL